MFAPPDVPAIREMARRVGIDLSEDDAAAIRPIVLAQLASLDELSQARMDQTVPPLLFPAREPGYRPSADEDPFDAWLWKSQIGGGTGLLAGKTVSFKDHVAVAGLPLTFSHHSLERCIPDFDATVVTKVLAAGGIVAGKNTHHGYSGIRGLGGYLGDYWEAINPHGLDRMTGGSSSGSAAAVAAGEVDIAFGGDQGGSIRQPAAYCGVLGHKPTFGLVSHMGITYGGEPSIDHIGPIAAHVEDIARALQAVAGYDGYDPRQDRTVPETFDALSTLDAGVSGLRIGVLEEGFDGPIDEEIDRGVMDAVSTLANAGAIVSKVSIPEHRTVQIPARALQLEGFRNTRATGPFGAGAKTYYSPAITAAVNRLLDDDTDSLAIYLKINYITNEFSRRFFRGLPYAKAQNVRPHFIRAYDDVFEAVDVLVMPTCSTVAPPRPEALPFAEAWPREAQVLLGDFSSFRNLQPFSYTGHPALAVPCGKVGGLPFSLQLVGRYFDDAVLLRVAYAFSQAVEWESLISIDDGR